MVLSRLLNCVAVEPSETLVLAGCAEDGEPALPLAGARAAASPVGAVGNGLPVLSIFTVILSMLDLWLLCWNAVVPLYRQENRKL